MIFKKTLVFFATFLLFGCPSQNVEQENQQKSENLVEAYEFEPIYITVQHKTTKNKGTKTKFYNFDDLLINGEYKKPQVLYTDSKQKVKFDKLLKLKKDFLPNLKNTSKDPTLR